jgi:hypothetical protein
MTPTLNIVDRLCSIFVLIMTALLRACAYFCTGYYNLITPLIPHNHEASLPRQGSLQKELPSQGQPTLRDNNFLLLTSCTNSCFMICDQVVGPSKPDSRTADYSRKRSDRTKPTYGNLRALENIPTVLRAGCANFSNVNCGQVFLLLSGTGWWYHRHKREIIQRWQCIHLEFHYH